MFLSNASFHLNSDCLQTAAWCVLHRIPFGGFEKAVPRTHRIDPVDTQSIAIVRKPSGARFHTLNTNAFRD